MNTTQPDIFNYNNFRAFLTDYQTACQMDDPTFSKSAFSKLLGLPNTRSYFNDVLNGKKVSAVFIERFIKVIGLKKEEAQFFRVLIKFNQADSADEREIYFDQLITLNRTPKRIIKKTIYIYYKNWYNSVIRALLNVYDFRGDSARLAKMVFPPISARQAKESITLLVRLGLIAKVNNGSYKPTDKSITTPDGERDELIKHYQLSCLEMAKNSLLKSSSLPQSVSTNVLSISKEGYLRLEKKVGQFRSEVRSLVQKDEHQADRVYQLDVLLFPNSRQRAL